MQCIDLSEIVHVGTAVIIVISVNFNSSTLLMVSCGLRAKVPSEWKLISGFETQKKCPFPLNRGNPFNRSNRYKHVVKIFPGPNFASPE